MDMVAAVGVTLDTGGEGGDGVAEDVIETIDDIRLERIRGQLVTDLGPRQEHALGLQRQARARHCSGRGSRTFRIRR